jgi:hypothetical protein
MVAVVAVKVAEADAAGTVTDGGTERVVLVLVIVTFTPPAGAGLDNVTVQVPVEFDPRLVGLQVSEVTRTGATRETAALAEVAP